MVRGRGRFDRRVRPAEDTDVFPAVKDDDYTGQIPAPAAAADAEVTGVIPAIRDVEDDGDDADVADLESQDAEPSVVGNDRLLGVRGGGGPGGQQRWATLVVR